MSDNGDWKAKLKEWLANNPKVMTEERRKAREGFVQHFPKEKLGKMTLERYALEHETSKESFSRGLEFGTAKQLGNMGERLHKVLGDDFLTKTETAGDDGNATRYEIKPLAGDALIAALQHLAAAPK